MPRETRFDKSQAVEKAMQMLWAQGYEASSVKAVSEHLGITRSSYYNAFGTREDLFRAAFTQYCAQSPDRYLFNGNDTYPVRVLLTALFKEICRLRAADPDSRGCLAINALSELNGVHDALEDFLAEAFIRNADRLERILSDAMKRGEISKSHDAHAMARSLHALMVGVNVLSQVVTEESELWLTCETTLKALDLFEPDGLGCELKE